VIDGQRRRLQDFGEARILENIRQLLAPFA
jgi:hypothetical protein